MQGSNTANQQATQTAKQYISN